MCALNLCVLAIESQTQAPEIMTQNMATVPHAHILHFLDWRFAQVQQGLQLHLHELKNGMDEKFSTLEESLSRFFTEFS